MPGCIAAHGYGVQDMHLPLPLKLRRHAVALAAQSFGSRRVRRKKSIIALLQPGS